MNSRALNNLEVVQPLTLCWWIFAVRGGLAVVFAVVLFLTSSFLGIFFFDPVTLVYLSLLLGSFVLGNGLLLGVAAGFAYEHRLHLWWLALAECCFAVLLGIYIGISLMLTSQSLALLAGIHALGAGLLSDSAGHQAARRPPQLVPAHDWRTRISLGGDRLSPAFPPGRPAYHPDALRLRANLRNHLERTGIPATQMTAGPGTFPEGNRRRHRILEPCPLCET